MNILSLLLTNKRRTIQFDLEGGKETIEAFARESGIKLPTEQLEHVSKRAQIRDTIHIGKIPQAIALIDQMYPDLLKSDNHLYFLLQQQHLIELIRQSNDEEALAFAQVIICYL